MTSRTWIACLIAAAAWAQPQTPAAARIEFEVASVKQFDESLRPGQPDLSFVGLSGKPFKIAGTRVSVKGTLRSLIADAYNVKDYQISATPPWASTLIFTIAAEAPGTAVPAQDQVRPMLQSLLAERCQLQLHRETRELPVYHLVQRKKSSLLKPADPGETFSWNVGPGPDGLMRSKATRESIGDFVQLVGVSADRAVIDKTGLTGDIDYDIQIYQKGVRSQDDANRAILDAVQDQLGLKLEPARDPIEMLVVERLEKPSDN